MVDLRGGRTIGLRERKKRQTRATLLSAAVELCEEQGFERTTVDQIAAIANVSPRTFSRYFPTKEAIALALIDDVLAITAAELARQPLDMCLYDAIRRAYVATAIACREGRRDALPAPRLLQLLRILMTSPVLRTAAVEFRVNAVDMVVAQRLGVGVDDRRVKLAAGVTGALMMTALESLADNLTSLDAMTVDDVIDAYEATFAEFTSEIAGIGQPV
ncbi:TetR family transcriptional regulator [Mycobacterium sp. pV006]|uniref:TetR family transcriptional regulator n=1 Tax=Mycobacterium sp. pV006 TaxID=3238983 RepID=UPI00351AB70A